MGGPSFTGVSNCVRARRCTAIAQMMTPWEHGAAPGPSRTCASCEATRLGACDLCWIGEDSRPRGGRAHHGPAAAREGAGGASRTLDPLATDEAHEKRTNRIDWARLLARTFDIEEACQGRTLVDGAWSSLPQVGSIGRPVTDFASWTASTALGSDNELSEGTASTGGAGTLTSSEKSSATMPPRGLPRRPSRGRGRHDDDGTLECALSDSLLLAAALPRWHAATRSLGRGLAVGGTWWFTTGLVSAWTLRRSRPSRG
jgi:hypothetical protein